MWVEYNGSIPCKKYDRWVSKWCNPQPLSCQLQDWSCDKCLSLEHSFFHLDSSSTIILISFINNVTSLKFLNIVLVITVKHLLLITNVKWWLLVLWSLILVNIMNSNFPFFVTTSSFTLTLQEGEKVLRVSYRCKVSSIFSPDLYNGCVSLLFMSFTTYGVDGTELVMCKICAFLRVYMGYSYIL